MSILGQGGCVPCASGLTYNNAERDSSSEIVLAGGRRMIERLKNVGIILGLAAMVGFSLFQLYCAWRHGVIYFEPSQPPFTWFGFAHDPFWYVVGVAFYGLVSIVFAPLLLSLVYGWRLEARNLRRWFRRPPLETAIREPLDREPGR